MVTIPVTAIPDTFLFKLVGLRVVVRKYERYYELCCMWNGFTLVSEWLSPASLTD